MKLRFCSLLIACLAVTFLSAETTTDTLRVQVYFRQGHAVLDSTYRQNGERLHEFLKKASQFRSDYPESFRSIKISSSASPEGSSVNNQNLAKRRAQSIVNFLAPFLDGMPYEINSLENDWGLLEQLVMEDPDMPYKEEVLNIIRNTPIWVKKNGVVVGGRKKQLMDLAGGKAWRYMYDRFFPEMRNSGVSVTCVVEIPQPEPEPEPEPEDPEEQDPVPDPNDDNPEPPPEN